MEIFFYGLFMDTGILSKNEVHASNPRIGYLNNYTLKIGNRASLIPCKNERSYGIVMTVDQESVDHLYSEESVSDYVPETVNIITNTGEAISATCYNLPLEMLSGSNSSYAISLYELATQIGFPERYLNKIKEMI